MSANVVVQPLLATSVDMYRRSSPMEAWAAAKTAGRQQSSVYLATSRTPPKHPLHCSLQRQRVATSAPTVRFADAVAAASQGMRPASRPAVYPTVLLRQIQRRKSQRRQAKLLAIRKQTTRASSAEKTSTEAKKDVKSKRNREILIHGKKPIFLFRRIGRVIAKMVAVCHTMQMYAVEAGLLDRYLVSVSMQAPREEQEAGKADGKKPESFVFDLDYFLTNKKNEMPAQVRQLLDKHPDERTDHDIELIGREVWKIPSIRKYSSRLQRMMCRIVRYMRCGKRRVVLRKGHIGFNVYFIYSGSVNVIMEKDDMGVFVKPEVVVLKKGACFGEIALLENTRRNATIVCAEPTELLVIDKDDYMKNGLSDQMKEETRLRYEFFRNWTPLANWPDAAIHALSYISRTEDFAYNRVVVDDSQRNEWLWFIAKGNGELLRFIDLEKCTDPQLLASLEKKGFEFMTTASKPAQQRSMVSFRSSMPDALKRGILKTGNTPQVAPSLSDGEPEQWQRSKWQGMPALLFGRPGRNKLAMVKRQQLALERKGEKLDRTSEPDKKDAPANVGKGIYLRIDKLVQGQCMGLEPLFPDMEVGRRYSQQRYSLVSQGCTIIHLPRVKFREMAPPDTLNHIALLLMEDYPLDRELGDKFINKSTWEIYKHGVVEALVQRQCQSRPSIENYLRFDAIRDIDHIRYTPVNQKDWNPATARQGKPASSAKKEKPPNRPKTTTGSLPPRAQADSTTESSQSSVSMSMLAQSADPALRDRNMARVHLTHERRSSAQTLTVDRRKMSIYTPAHPHRQSIVHSIHSSSSTQLVSRTSPSKRSLTSRDYNAPAEKPQTVRELRHVRLSQIIDLQRLLERRKRANDIQRNVPLPKTNVNYSSNRGVQVTKATFTTSPDEIHLPSTVQH